MKRILRRDAREYYLTVQQPRLEVSPGEPFVIETEDAVNGLLRSEDDLPVPERYGSAYHPESARWAGLCSRRSARRHAGYRSQGHRRRQPGRSHH